jgi:hypothetical protein
MLTVNCYKYGYILEMIKKCFNMNEVELQLIQIVKYWVSDYNIISHVLFTCIILWDRTDAKS